MLGADPHPVDADLRALVGRYEIDGWIEVGREKGFLAKVAGRPAPAGGARDVLPELVVEQPQDLFVYVVGAEGCDAGGSRKSGNVRREHEM
jgi:hypothetical protein